MSTLTPSSPEVLTPSGPVPFFDLGPMHAGLKKPILEAIDRIVSDGTFTQGEEVRLFEDAFAAFCGARTCVGMSSGLDALRVALRAVGVGPGDEVILPAQTFFATAEAVIQLGATPVFVDISRTDLNIDVAQVEAAISDRVRAILPVHLFGQLADMRALQAIASNHSLPIVEDACQAHGADRDDLRAGASGTIGVFSFYPSKNLGAFGDGGAAVTDDETLAELMRVLREHGQLTKYHHIVDGYTARLDTIQASVLLQKLPQLASWNSLRVEAAGYYEGELAGLGDLELPPVPPGSKPVWHLYVVRTRDPEELERFLRERGIGTGRHYPVPIHLTPALHRLGYKTGSFPVAEDLALRGISLPLFPGITEEQLETVVTALRAYFDGS